MESGQPRGDGAFQFQCPVPVRLHEFGQEIGRVRPGIEAQRAPQPVGKRGQGGRLVLVRGSVERPLQQHRPFDSQRVQVGNQHLHRVTGLRILRRQQLLHTIAVPDAPECKALRGAAPGSTGHSWKDMGVRVVHNVLGAGILESSWGHACARGCHSLRRRGKEARPDRRVPAPPRLGQMNPARHVRRGTGHQGISLRETQVGISTDIPHTLKLQIPDTTRGAANPWRFRCFRRGQECEAGRGLLQILSRA